MSCVKNPKIEVYKTIILISVLYGCEFPLVREEHRLRMSEKKVLG
jgi:hypothetical protein